jgi:hypothetical protein
MKPFKFYLRAALVVVLVTGVVLPVLADRYIYDENGAWTGLVNVNPDPYGEPWTVGGYEPISDEEKAQIQELQVSQEYLNRTLPKTVDNTKNPEFRPIFNQIGGSCAQASSISYIYTYEMNCILNLPSNTAENQFPYGYTHNFLNRGANSNGSSCTGGWSIVQTTGCPTIKDFNNLINGGLSGTAWMKTYTGYHNANFNRVKSIGSISKVNTPEGLLKLKQYLFDHADESKKGGCVVFASYHGFTYTTIASGPFAGQKLATLQAGSADHAMTFAGYTDEIAYDFNGDGRITNDVDVNRDGNLDVSDYELGAVLLVNSWGASFGNGGKVWLAYGSLASITGTSVQYPIVAINKPKLELKINFTHDTRNLISVKAGFSATPSATAPSETKGFSSAFKTAGGAFPLEGAAGSSTIEIGLDVSDYVAKFVQGKGMLFLQIVSTGGTGQVNSLSAIDYTGATPVETKCSQNNVAITGTINMGVAVSLSVTRNTPEGVSSEKGSAITIQKTSRGHLLFIPSNERCRVIVTNIQGRVMKFFVTSGEPHWYPLGENTPSGLYLVSIKTANETIIKKINSME